MREHFGDPRDSTIGVKPAYETLSAYFNQDYGAGQYRGIYLQGNEAAREVMTAWMQPFRDLGLKRKRKKGVLGGTRRPFEAHEVVSLWKVVQAVPFHA